MRQCHVSRMTGENIYLDYDQAQLDAQYNQLTLVPDRGPYIEFWKRHSIKARRLYTHELEISYGPGETDLVDIYPPERSPAPVVLFVHGGAWLREIRPHAHYPVLALKQRDICFVAAGFSAVPNTDLPGMVAQIRRCLTWVWRNIASYGGDPNRIFALGHSSGAHMSAMLTAKGWQAHAGLPKDAIKGAGLVSGLYDLVPVQLSARNEYLKLKADDVASLSPLTLMPDARIPHVIAWADGDLDEFQRQSETYGRALDKAGHPTRMICVSGRNHFEMANSLAEPDGDAVSAFLDML
jgi:arylformamidase